MSERNFVNMDDCGNTITQNITCKSVRVAGKLYDKRTDKVEEFNTFFIMDETDDWKQEYYRIIHRLGFDDAGIEEFWIRENNLGGGSMFASGKETGESLHAE